MRDNFLLECSECGDKNYISEKNKNNTPDKVEIMKYCPRDRKMTLHRETKKK